MEIVKATGDDLVGIIYVQATSWITYYPNPLAKISEADLRAVDFAGYKPQWQHALKSSDYRVWVAKEAQNILAFLALRLTEQEAEVYQQHTLPNHRNQGLGTQLWDLARLTAADRSLVLRIPVYLEDSLDFYRRRGLRVDETGAVDFINLPTGKQIPTVLLRRVSSTQEIKPDTVAEIDQKTEQIIAETLDSADSSPVNPGAASLPVKLIGRAKLAQLSGIRPSTIKFYTEEGILPFEQSEPRLARRYHQQVALERLKEINKLRQRGLSVEQIKQHLREMN